MQLTDARSRELLCTHGVYSTEACDKCGVLLGPIRWTIRGEAGVWCSRKSRDGVDHNPYVCRGCGTSLVGKRRGAMYCDRTCRMRTVRREVMDSANTVNMPVQKTGVAGVISAFG